MNEKTTVSAVTGGTPGSAGAQLRKARESQRLPIEALAAAIKVPPQKLKLLEADRFGELPDPAFARALAQTVCRYLKIDPVPVLALLPPAVPNRMTNLTEGLNEPFRERVIVDGFEWRRVASPAVWAPLLLLVAAAWLYLAPPELLSRLTRSVQNAAGGVAPAAAPTDGSGASIVTEVLRTPGTAAPPASGPAASPGPVAVQPAFPSAPPPEATAAGAAAALGAGGVQIETSGESWVEVVDADGRSLIARNVPAGESLRLEGTPPLRVKIGNAGAVLLRYKGEPVDLGPSTRGSVARLRLN